MPAMVKLTFQGLNGDTLTTLDCSLSMTVYEVKQRLSNVMDAMVGRQQLAYGCHTLEDKRTLKDCGIQADTTLQCIRICPSGIANHLDSQKDAANPDDALVASMADIADSIMQVEHARSERHMPCPKEISCSMTRKRRAELVSWMVQAFETLQFSDEILHSTVLTLDRYYARKATAIPDSQLQKILLAAVCTEMKLASNTEFPQGHWQRIIAHLCQGRLSVPCILREEAQMLKSLDFVVGVPTALMFMQGLSINLEEDTHTTEARELMSSALFFLELALGDPELMYSYPQAVLAAAALSAAIRACGAPEEKLDQVLEGLSAYCPSHTYIGESVAACEEDLLTLWLRSSRNENELGDFYMRLDAKFKHRAGHVISNVSPEAALQRHRQATSPRSSASESSGLSPERSMRECLDELEAMPTIIAC